MGRKWAENGPKWGALAGVPVFFRTNISSRGGGGGGQVRAAILGAFFKRFLRNFDEFLKDFLKIYFEEFEAIIDEFCWWNFEGILKDFKGL